MRYIDDISKIKLNNTVVTIGKFDGNHVGHQLLFKTALELKEYAMDSVILSFDDRIFDLSNDKRNIFSESEKNSNDIYEKFDYLIRLDFNEIKDMYPEEFVEKILVKKLGVKKIVVGNDFCFGKDRMGDIRTLYDLGEIFKYEVFALEKIRYDGVDVSSTRIKDEILKGNFFKVNQMLGKPFSITGEIVKGKQIGKTIGFPTINVDYDEKKILPPDGGYATIVVIDGERFQSITNIGKNPTVNGEKRTVEAHIFDFDKDVYGKTAKIEFYKYLRPEEKFDSLEELKKEIEKNKQEVIEYFKSMS